ncbi:MAG: zinc-dependent alcohol dehydrogenase family protein [Clostridiales Family XIII bacterium]|jgi:D-arabinitol dehydrogenase (NADP+)|nr:zinc-dependent alcohol dehydrogenase family protein [Clostridiales Family XIII bacterium]
MRAVVYEEPKKFSVRDVPKPPVSGGQVLIEVKSCGICRTDAHIHNGAFISRFPLTPGHEFAGVVAEVGPDVKGFSVGDRVTADNTVLCGECYYCRRDIPLFCENFYSLGCNGPGGFAQYVLVGYDKVFSISDRLSFRQAAFTEPTACAVHGMDVIEVRPGDDVLVFGAGPTGIILTQLLRHGGAGRVVVCASSQAKLDLVARGGYARTVPMDRSDYGKHAKILREAFPRGFDIVIDATGASAVLQQAFDFVKPRGKVVVYGVCGEEETIEVRPYQFFEKEIKLLGSFAQTHCFDRALMFLEEGIVKVDDLVTDVYGLEDYAAALDRMLFGKDVLKVLVEP